MDTQLFAIGVSSCRAIRSVEYAREDERSDGEVKQVNAEEVELFLDRLGECEGEVRRHVVQDAVVAQQTLG